LGRTDEAGTDAEQLTAISAAAVVTMRRTRSFAAAERTKVATLRSVSDSPLRRRGLLTGSDATSGLSSRRHDAHAVSRPW
jgi:hypothetical protein